MPDTRLPRIAVVDGDVSTRKNLVSMLEARGWAVQAYPSLRSATYALVPSPPDLLIAEVALPDGFGLNLVEIVRRRNGGAVPMIAVTATASEQDMLRCFAAGAADVMVKPLREAEVVARCRVHLARAADPELPSPETPDVPMIEGLAFGRYKIVRELGRGGFGIVYLAEDREAQRLVALKVSIPPPDDGQAQARFVRETFVLSSVKSPHVVAVLDTGIVHGKLYYAMEYIPGPSLVRRVTERGALSENEARPVLRALLEALAATEEAGVLHRDVKPSNVILRDGELSKAVLIDFGLAKQWRDRALTNASGEHSLIGTPAFMPPEVIGGADHDHRSDLWSLGVTMRYALAGDNLWPKLDGMQLFQAVATRPVPALEVQLSEGFKNLLESLWAYDPVARPPNARVALVALERICAEEAASDDKAIGVAADKDPLNTADPTPRASSTLNAPKISFHDVRPTPPPDAASGGASVGPVA
jgi:CheY-like chemotaxis protein